MAHPDVSWLGEDLLYDTFMNWDQDSTSNLRTQIKKPISRTQIKKPMGNPFQEHELNGTSTSNSNRLKQEPMTNYWVETFNSNIWPIENQEKETKHVLEFLL